MSPVRQPRASNTSKWSIAQRALTSGNDAATAAGELLQRAARYSGCDPAFGTNAIIGPVSTTPLWGGESRPPCHRPAPSHATTRLLLLAALSSTGPQHPASQREAIALPAAGPGPTHLGRPHYARRPGPPPMATTAYTHVRPYAPNSRGTMPHRTSPSPQGRSILDPPGHQHHT